MGISHISQFVVYLLSLILLVFLVAILIVGAGRKSRKFIDLIAALILWLVPQFLAQYFLFRHYDASVVLIKLSLFFAGLVALSLSIFIKSRIQESRGLFLTVLAVVGPILGILCLTPLDQLSVSVSNNGIAVSGKSPLYLLITAVVFLDFAVAIISLISEERRKKHKKEDAKAITSLRNALTISLLMNLAGAIFFANKQWSQVLTPVSIVIFGILSYNAIFRHRLFDIRSFVARSMAYIASILFMGGLFGWLAIYLTGQLLPQSKSLNIERDLIQIIFVTIAVLTFRPLKLFFDRITNKIFFRDAYDPQTFLDELNQILVSTLELRQLLDSVNTVIERNLKSQFSYFIIEDGSGGKFRVFSKRDHQIDVKQIDRILKNTKKQKIIHDDELQSTTELSQLLRNSSISVMARLDAKQRERQSSLGWLVLGGKSSGNQYSRQDMQIIEIITNELAIAVQNALRFEEIEQFNLTLQQKVDDATRNLRKANERLRELDETKDDFISMASHQLRTPLTSVKGYISMVLDGDVGKISKAQKDMLDQAFFSSQRMVYLIADLLNVSRLKTGKFVIESAPVNLAEMVHQELSQLGETASSKNLTLTYNKPKDFPALMLDETKTRQVIMNFVDNAIYYTPAGGRIDVKLIDKPESVELRVVDNGIGVPKTEQHHLFTKFYRAGNARKARPDGTGLGLFMAKKVVVAEGGSIIFESQEGKGSTFGFVFSKAKLSPKGHALKPAETKDKSLAVA